VSKLENTEVQQFELGRWRPGRRKKGEAFPGPQRYGSQVRRGDANAHNTASLDDVQAEAFCLGQDLIGFRSRV
jgi:hypothetical protein